MRRIEDLSEQEILALKEEDIQRFIKLRMAEEGIKLLKRPQEPKLKETPKPTVTGYGVEGFSYKFQDKAAAERVALAIQKEKGVLYSTDYFSDYSMKFLRRVDTEYSSVGDVKPEMFLEKIVAENYSAASRENKKLQEEYNQLLREYNNEEERADSIREEIYGRVNEVTRKYERLEDLRARFSEYLDLAEGNSEVAMKFLRKAYSVDADDEAYVLAQLPTEAEK